MLQLRIIRQNEWRSATAAFASKQCDTRSYHVWTQRDVLRQRYASATVNSAHTLWSSSPSAFQLISLATRQFSSAQSQPGTATEATSASPATVATPLSPATRPYLDALFSKVSAFRKEAIQVSLSQGPLTSWQKRAPSYLSTTNPRWDSLRKESDATFIELRRIIPELRKKSIFVKDHQWEQLFSYLKVSRDAKFTWNFYNLYKQQVIKRLANTEFLVKKHSASESKEAIAKALDTSLSSTAREIQPAPNVLAVLFECMSFAVTGDQSTPPFETQKQFQREIEWMGSTPYLRIVFSLNAAIYSILFNHFINQKVQPQLQQIQDILSQGTHNQSSAPESATVAQQVRERTLDLLKEINAYVNSPQFAQKNEFSYSSILQLYVKLFSIPFPTTSADLSPLPELEQSFDAFVKQMNEDKSVQLNYIHSNIIAQAYLVRLGKLQLGSLGHQQLNDKAVKMIENVFEANSSIYFRSPLISSVLTLYGQYDQVDNIHKLIVRAMNFDNAAFDEYRARVLSDASTPQRFTKDIFYNKKKEWQDSSKAIRSRHLLESPQIVLDNMLLSQFMSLLNKSPSLRDQTPSQSQLSFWRPAKGMNKFIKFAATLVEWMNIRKQQVEQLQIEAQEKRNAEVERLKRDDPAFEPDYLTLRMPREVVSVYEVSDSLLTSYLKLMTDATSVSQQEISDFWKSVDVARKRANPHAFTVLLSYCSRNLTSDWSRPFAGELIAEMNQLKLRMDQVLVSVVLRVFERSPLPITAAEFDKLLKPSWEQLVESKKKINPGNYRSMINIYANIKQQQSIVESSELPSQDECRSRAGDLLNEMRKSEYDVKEVTEKWYSWFGEQSK